MKTVEELNALKEEVETLNQKLAELTDEELAEVSGGVNPVTPVHSDLQLVFESTVVESTGVELPVRGSAGIKPTVFEPTVVEPPFVELGDGHTTIIN